MATEYIEKQAAMDAIHNHYEVRNPEQNALMDEVSMLIFRLPAAAVRPVVRGKWEKSYADHEAFGVRPFFRYCSKCHEATVYPYNFCPNCGSYNGGDADGDEKD